MRFIARTCQELQRAGDNRQQIVEVVRDAACKLTDRLQILYLEQLGLRFAARCRLRFDPGTQMRVQPLQFGVGLIQRQRPVDNPLFQSKIRPPQRIIRLAQFLGQHGGFLQGNPDFPLLHHLGQRPGDQFR